GHLVELVRIVARIIVAEMDRPTGAVVLRIGVDLTGFERLTVDVGATEVDLSFGRAATGFDGLCEHLREDLVLGEVLRSDRDRDVTEIEFAVAFPAVVTGTGIVFVAATGGEQQGGRGEGSQRGTYRSFRGHVFLLV